MGNPWKTISLSDYENHMSSDTVMQLQALNEMMLSQLSEYDADTAMILGVAGGNGLEHIDTNKYTAVYGVDVNPGYLQTVRERYTALDGTLQCLCIDLTKEAEKLPAADLVIANLLIEYIGCECFQKVIKQVRPKYISCGIQIDLNEGFVSQSQYTHSFDKLGSIHHQIDKFSLEDHMSGLGYHLISEREYPLPNGKKLVRSDFSGQPGICAF